MKPRLFAIHGPLKGTAFHLDQDEVMIGRGSDNALAIPDRRLSRRHCVIRREGDRFRILDQGSTNGTLLNGIPVKERLLEVGDQISLSDSVFVFDRLGVEDSFAGCASTLEERPTVSQTLVRLTVEEAARVQQDGLVLHHLPAARLSRDLNTLLRINSLLGSEREPETLQGRLVELVFQGFSVQSGGIVFADQDGSNVTLISHPASGGEPGEPFRPSRTILEAVLRGGTPILSNHVLEDPALAAADSLVERGVRSVLCVPLVVAGPRVAALYLENHSAERAFDEHHLRLLTAIAGAAAAGLGNAESLIRLRSEHQRLQATLALDQSMLGRSPAMQKVFDLIARVAPTGSTVLILGESGTGKELAARAIHRNSPRADQPFLAVNCATLTDTLLESELFGHEKGAFTGAVGRKPGKLELADGGTVLLDEIGELAPELQAKLLRFLQEREFERVGGTTPIRVDVRILSSTNRDLEAAIGEERFRRDLYYRLNVVSLEMPPLRERAGDVLLLAEVFLDRFSEKCNRLLEGFDARALRCFERYTWPGNVRELQNAVERAVVMSSGPVIVPEDLPEAVLESRDRSETPTSFQEQISEKKRELVVAALECADGNITQAAESLGIHRTYLHRLIRNLGLQEEADD